MEACEALSRDRIAKSVPKGTDLWLGVVALFANEKKGPDTKAGVLCPLPYVWRRSRAAVCAAFRRSALSTTRGPEALSD
jgi:hypothetical protein